MDLEYVGIWGYFGGGFVIVVVMFKYLDFFDVGIFEFGNYDN